MSVLRRVNRPQPSDSPTRFPDALDARLLWIAGVCVLASLTVTLDSTVVFVAQRTFINVFQSNEAVVAWTMTGYVLALATVTPLAGWAADRFGAKRLFIGSVLAFTLGSLLCTMASNIAALIVFRVLQGFGGGLVMPIVMTILAREAGPKRLGRLMAVAGTPMLLGPVGGPILGGWLIYEFGWKWIFLINLPIGLITIALAAAVFPKDEPAPSEAFDLIGVLLLSPGLATLLYGLSSLPAHRTPADPHVWVPVTLGLVLITGFVLHALYRTEHPLIDVRLFTNRVVTLANVVMFLFAIAIAGAGLLCPSYFQQLLHHTPLQAGLAVIPIGVGGMLTLPLAGVLLDKHGPGKVVLAGIALVCLGTGLFAYGVANHAGYLPVLFTGLAIVGLGMGCTQMLVAGVAVQTLAPHQLARGSTLVNVNQHVAGSVAYALMSVILTNQFIRSENITAAQKLATLQDNAAKWGAPVDPAAIPHRALSPDFAGSVLHDLTHAYTVVFVVVFVLTALSFIPAAFLPKQAAVSLGVPSNVDVPARADA